MLRHYCTRLYANRNVESLKSWWSFLQGIADALSGNCQRFDATSLSSPSEVVRAKAARQPIHCTDIRSRLLGLATCKF
jgi:hypothetical protein